MPQPSTQEVFEACRILFGEEIHVSFDFLRYLQPSGVKSAYWKRARETHPDLAEALGMNPSILSERFKTIVGAYETLHAVIREGKGLRLTDPPGSFHAGQPGRNPNFHKQPFTKREEDPDHYYNGRFPNRRMLIGQFLYYSGVISWRTLIAAVLWQRRNRPLIGQIAVDWKMLTHADIQRILRDKRISEKFGESALRMGYITHWNLMALLGKQRKSQKPIGVYFVDRKILRPDELTQHLLRQRLHNRKFFR